MRPHRRARRARTRKRPTSVPGTWHFDDYDTPQAGDWCPTVPRSMPDSRRLRKTIWRSVEYPFAKTRAIAARLVVGPSPNHTLVEQFRHLAAALHHAQLRAGTKTVMIASAVEAEGKTTTAANLALTFSQSHQRRVLLDRRGSSASVDSRAVSAVQPRGLDDALKVVTPNTPLPLHQISPTLSVLTAGEPTADPMSALVSDMMKQFMIEAAQQFDWVVLDTPPVALLSDANLLAAMIDAALLVVSANTTPYPLVRRAVEAIGPSKILGVVLNRAKRSEIAGHSATATTTATATLPTARRPPRRRWALPFRRKR